MRDREEYLRHGRNDPLAPDQLAEHPYDFVSLPDVPAIGEAVGHADFPADCWSGRLTFLYRTETPLHIGSGVLETAEECGLAGGSKPVRSLVRQAGRPVLPGAGWKGVVRSRYEAITRSRLGTTTRLSRVSTRKLPEVLRPPGAAQRVEVVLADRRLSPFWPKDSRPLAELSPAEALFGALGYRGRVHPSEGTIEGPSAVDPLSVPPLESPAAHRLAVPGGASVVAGKVQLSRIEGRKFYYDGPLLDARPPQREHDPRPVQEWIEAVPAGCTIRIEVQVESLRDTELGVLLLAAGYGPDSGVVRFGGYKPAGLGKVSLREVAGTLRPGVPPTVWPRPAGEPLDPMRFVEAARHSGFLDTTALTELREITTRQRPKRGAART